MYLVSSDAGSAPEFPGVSSCRGFHLQLSTPMSCAVAIEYSTWDLYSRAMIAKQRSYQAHEIINTFLNAMHSIAAQHALQCTGACVRACAAREAVARSTVTTSPA
ncbi:unnamed protein product, partial [Sphacelaria rigidula]